MRQDVANRIVGRVQKPQNVQKDKIIDNLKVEKDMMYGYIDLNIL